MPMLLDVSIRRQADKLSRLWVSSGSSGKTAIAVVRPEARRVWAAYYPQCIVLYGFLSSSRKEPQLYTHYSQSG
jgi:phenylacetate-coenzyme A ligase PaaK-like adenylate-forming protein